MSRPIAYMGDHVALTMTKYGKKIYVDTDDLVVSPHILMEGAWEPWIDRFLEGVLGEGATFVDVGAHVGWYTLLACETVGESGFVHSFEPNPRLADLVRRSLSVNGFNERRCNFVEKAASDEEGQASMFVPHLHSGNGTLREDPEEEIVDEVRTPDADGVSPGLGRRRGDVYGRRFQVYTTRLDSVVAHADLIKIDAEGYETHVLRGAWGLFRRNDAGRLSLLVEHHPDNEDEPLCLKALMDEFGYKLAVVEHDGLLKSVAIEELGDIPDSEMLFLERR